MIIGNLFVDVGSLASCPDPNIVLEVLNFVLSSEVRVLFIKLINLNILKLEVTMLIFTLYRFEVKMLFSDLLLVGKDVKQLGHG